MLGKMFGSIVWAFAIVAFFIWIFLSTKGAERIDRACTPIDWTGNFVSSIVSILTPKYEESFENGFKKAEYTCQYTLWRFAYEEDYLALQKEQQVEKEAQPESSGGFVERYQ